MADSQRKTSNLFDKDNAERFYYGKGENNTVGYAVNGAMFCFKINHNTNYTCKVYDNHNTLLRMYRSNYPLTKPESNNSIEYVELIEQEVSLNPQATINSGDCDYLWVQFSGNWYNSYEGNGVMLNTGSTALPYEPYGWLHSLRKLTTATEAVENPLYSDGSPITAYTLKGNTVQNGTPSPQNPVMPNGVGERTENVYNKYNVIQVANLGTRYGSYVDNGVYSIYNDTDNDVYWGGNGFQSRYLACSPHSTATVDMTSYSYSDYGFIMAYNDASLGDITIVEGSTAPDHYIPYGYKIPIPNGQQTTNIYLSAPLQKLYTYSDNLQSDGTIIRNSGKVELTGEENVEYISNYGQFKVQTSYYRRPPYDETSYLCTHYKAISNAASWAGDNYITVSQGDAPDRFYRIKDSRFSTAEDFKTYLAQQYANGTPVTIYFVKAAATTETITAPSISTTEGANSITVDTTVQPSEFTATWTGWHDAYVKEKSENLFGAIVEQGSYNPSTGATGASDTRVRTTFDSILPAGSYTINCTGATGGVVMYIYSTDDTSSFVANESVTNWQNLPYRFTLTKDRYVRFGFRKSDNSNIVPSEISNLMLNTGSTALPYEPYWK